MLLSVPTAGIDFNRYLALAKIYFAISAILISHVVLKIIIGWLWFYEFFGISVFGIFQVLASFWVVRFCMSFFWN